VEEQRPGLLALALRFTGSMDEAEDLVQTVLGRVLDGLRRGSMTPSAAYLFTAVANAGRTFKRDRQSRSRRDVLLAAESSERTNPLHPDRWMARRDAARRVKQLLKSCTPRQREAVTLVLLEDMTYRAAGARLGLSPNTVREHVRRARKRMRERLEDRGEAPELEG